MAVGVVGAWRPMEGVDPNTVHCDPEGLISLLLPSFTECNQFYMCTHGREVLFTCPDNLIFNFVTQTCDWDWATECVLRRRPGESIEKSSSSEEEAVISSEEENQEKESEDDASDSIQVPESSESEDNASGGDQESSEEHKSDSSESEDNVSGGDEGSSEEDANVTSSEEAVPEGSGEDKSISSEEEKPVTSEESSGGGDDNSLPEWPEEEGSGDSGEDNIDEGSGTDGSGSDEGSGDGSGDFEWFAFQQDVEEPTGVQDLALGPLLSLLMPKSEFGAFLDCSDANQASRQLAYKGDCQRYWLCVGNVAYTAYCSDGLFFNEQRQQCDFEANVNCVDIQDDELQGEFMLYTK